MPMAISSTSRREKKSKQLHTFSHAHYQYYLCYAMNCFTLLLLSSSEPCHSVVVDKILCAIYFYYSRIAAKRQIVRSNSANIELK